MHAQRFLFMALLAALLSGIVRTAAFADCDAAATPASLLFVTDRSPLGSEQLFSGERGKAADRAPLMSYGVIGSPPGPATEHLCSSRAAFFAAMRKRFASTVTRRALIYVHGYYRSFKQAADAALLLQQSLHVDGPVVLYSWPSKQTSRLTYVNDESNSNWSTPHFIDFLADVEKMFPNTSISFATHSLGGRFAAAGMQFLRHSSCTACLGRSVFFAPDVDSDVLYDEFLASGLCAGGPAVNPPFAAQITLYVSNRDVALRESQQLHGHQRAGQAGSEIILCRGVDTIDVSYVRGQDSAGHTYHVYPQILGDAAAAFAGISPASRQRKLKGAARTNGVYYELRP